MIDETLLNTLFNAIAFCHSITLNGIIYDEDGEELMEIYNAFEIQDIPDEITLDSRIEFCREDDYEEDSCSKIKVKEFIDLYSNLNDYELVENSVVYGKKLALFFVAGIDDYTIAKLEKDPIDNWCHTKIFIDSKEYKVEFMSERQVIFDILLLKDRVFDKELSPNTRDCFIKVSSKDKLDREIACDLAESLIFELATSYKILLYHSKMIDGLDLDSIEIEHNAEGKMFPLLTGDGIPELLKLYNETLDMKSLDYQILSLTKIIEYIAPTVAKEQLINCVVQKLSCPQVLNPRAEYILKLQAIFDKHRNKCQKDSELIKMVVSTVIDLDEIRDDLPAFLRINNKLSDEQRSKIIDNLSTAISNTRNYIAHAKANYCNKDFECPEQEKGAFINILRIISRQCIRWFYHQPTNKRVLNNRVPSL